MSDPPPGDITKPLPTQHVDQSPDTNLDPERTRTASPETEGLPPPGPEGWPANFPTIPGFEIHGVLGRGGMGVVYKAWQIGLKRHVALKMILAGEHAGPQHLARFRAEAQAVAQLQHPHIVQIYEIGDYQGRPYFCMEFVDGGSLSRLLGHEPQAPEQAARLVEMLARAMHYTHQRGIVHRDLKPANVLLQIEKTGESSATLQSAIANLQSAIPKVTDFGLAKDLQEEGGQTVSGAVLGTPGYMAPEQAAGKVHAVGPLADVYALGAILYEMLTGRAPFRGDSHMDTLRQVISEEPLPPSRHQPRIPRDLETICLKALAKEPNRRYASALMLAQDLERCGAGEPILARREGVFRRMVRRARRNPRAVVTGVLAVSALVAVIYFSLSASSARRLADFAKEFEPRLQKVEWTAAYLDEMEKLIARIEAVAPERAAVARDELYQRHYAESIRRAMKLDRALTREDVGRIEAALELLKNRGSDLEVVLRKDFTTRLGAQQTVCKLQPPFDNAETALLANGLSRSGKALMSPVNNADPIVLLRETCTGNVQMEAVFAYPSWGSVPQLGLLFDALPGKKRHYSLVLATGASPTEEDPKGARPGPSLEQARIGKGWVYLRIQRDGFTLRQETLAQGKLTPKPLTVRATREGSLLTLEVFQDLKLVGAVRFQDIFPPAGTEAGAFALHWPAKVELQMLQARRQTLPLAPGPLEQGDYFFALGEFEKAHQLFHERAAAQLERAVHQEARCKEALSLVQLKRFEDAVALLAPLANEEGERWPVMAACQLWLLYLRQNQRDDADALVETLLSRGYRPEQLALVIPDDLRERIGIQYHFSPFALLFRNEEKRVRGLERMIDFHDYLRDREINRFYLGWNLMRAHRINGQGAKAMTLLERSLLEDPWLARDDLWRVLWLEELGWTGREIGAPEQALQTIQRELQKARKGEARFRRLLVERARLRIAQAKWPEAEQDLQAFFADLQNAPQASALWDYQPYAAACLIQGFLKERQKDSAGAREAWKKGLKDSESMPPSIRWEHPGGVAGGISHLQTLVLASLSDQLSEADAAGFQQRLLGLLPAEYRSAVTGLGYRFSADVVRDMWRTSRGRDYARHIAFQDVPLADYLKMPIVALSAAIIRKEALPADISPEQDELVWKLAEDAWAALRAGKLGQANMIQLGLAWKGTTNFFGWGGLSKAVEPSMRGPLAYVLGHRFIRLKQDKQGADLFRTARDDAPMNSVLRQLADAELKRLDSKTMK